MKGDDALTKDKTVIKGKFKKRRAAKKSREDRMDQRRMVIPLFPDELRPKIDNPPFIVAVYSPKGGVGKTSVSLSLSALINKATDNKCILVDADIEHGNVARYLGNTKEPNVLTLAHYIEKKGLPDNDEMEKFLLYHNWSELRVLLSPPSPKSVQNSEEMKKFAGVYRQITETCSKYFDMIFFDCAVELKNELARYIIEVCDLLLLVADTNVATLDSLHSSIEMLEDDYFAMTLGGSPKDKMKMVFNKVTDKVGINLKEMEEEFSDIEQIGRVSSLPHLVQEHLTVGVPLIFSPSKTLKKDFFGLAKEVLRLAQGPDDAA